MPSSLMVLMMEKISLTRSGARPMDGSSSKRTRGRSIKARPMASICCSPPDRVPESWFFRSKRRGKSSKTFFLSFSMPSLSLRRYAPISRFSITDILAKTWRPSGTWTRPEATILWAGVPVISVPSKRMLPERGLMRPEIVWSVVDLPAPFDPMRVTICPSSTRRLMPLTAWMAP